MGNNEGRKPQRKRRRRKSKLLMNWHGVTNSDDTKGQKQAQTHTALTRKVNFTLEQKDDQGNLDAVNIIFWPVGALGAP